MEALAFPVPSLSKDSWKYKTLFLLPYLCFFLCSVMAAARSLPRPRDNFISEEDYHGLQAFKHALNDPHGFLRTWNHTGIGACSGHWLGIKCVNGRVVAIQLPWRGLSGHITEKIGKLTALRKLSLHDNKIGGQIPSSIGFLTNLRGLILFNNHFSGEAPASIGNLHKLQTLDLSFNLLSGKITESIWRCSKLYRLNLSYNNFSGEIPAGIVTSPVLTFLSLQHNALSGPIPESTAHQLQFLNLDQNHLSGFIPASFGNLRSIREITLSNNQLIGSIPEEIGSLSMLQTLDISKNSIDGRFPPSLCNLSSLIKLNLSCNQIKYSLPNSIGKLGNLSVLSMRKNQFSGQIPSTIGNISNLTVLDLSDNNFTGEIPVSLSQLSMLSFLNVSINRLSGRVPAVLAEVFNSSSFTGNSQLCGYSSTLCPAPSPTNLLLSPSLPLDVHRRRLSLRNLLVLVGGFIFVFLVLLFCALLFFVYRKRATAKEAGKEGLPAGTERAPGRDFGGKLVRFEGPLSFTADDLLCATAEIMGKSSFGTLYKATLEDGNQVAVKRLREKMVKNQKEFEAEVNELGKIRHPNLLPMRAYYLGPKGEKLLVFDFILNGSLATFLRARSSDTVINWILRMKIAMGIARGLSHLHDDMGVVHGNLTSANVLLDDGHNVKIADFGLSRLMTDAANCNNANNSAGSLGYQAPEFSKLKKADAKTDVFSLGIIMLELLTGKAPCDVYGVSFPEWVVSVVKGEWTNEVFDLELVREASGNTGDELVNTLKLALHCVDPRPTARPEVREVLRQLEGIKPELAAAGEAVEAGGGDADDLMT